jgi:hypothetical protein
MKSTFQIQMQGFPAANRDATVQLVQEGTGQTIELKPYLDGSLTVRDLESGMYQVTVKHPNSMVPIYQNRVRLFDQVPPTYIPIAIDPGLFQNYLPKAHVADLSVVAKAASACRDQVRPVAGKAAGEVIRSSDWNALANAVNDLASAVVQLTGLVAPLGHNHPDLVDQINNIQDVLNGFGQTFGRAQLIMQRQIEVETFQGYSDKAMAAGKATTQQQSRIDTKLKDLTDNLDADSTTFTYKLTAAANTALQVVNELSTTAGAAFLQNNDVKSLIALATKYATIGVQTDPGNEVGGYVNKSGGYTRGGVGGTGGGIHRIM